MTPFVGRCSSDRQRQELSLELPHHRRLEYGERLASQVRADWLPVIEREQKTQVGQVRLEQRQAPKVVSAVPRDNAQPRVEEAVGLLEEAAVVDGHRLHRFGRLVLERPRVRPVQHKGERASSEEVAVNLQFGERIAKLADGRVGRVVDEHFFRSCL